MFCLVGSRWFYCHKAFSGSIACGLLVAQRRSRAPLSSIRGIRSCASSSLGALLTWALQTEGLRKGVALVASGIQGLETQGLLFTICFHGPSLIDLSSRRIQGSLIKTVWLVAGGRKSQIVEEMVTFLDLFYVYLGDKHTRRGVRVFVGLVSGCISERRHSVRCYITRSSATLQINLQRLWGARVLALTHTQLYTRNWLTKYFQRRAS